MKLYRKPMLGLCLASLVAATACADGDDAGARDIAVLPDCGALDYDGTHADCRLAFEDGRQMVFDFTADAASDEWGERIESVDITLAGAEGQVLQTFADTAGRSFSYPSLADVDGDGDIDLLVPQETGNVNTTSHVWLQDGAQFIAAGSISGVGIDPVGGGLMAVHARSSAAEWETTYYIARDNRLIGLFSVSTDFSDDSCAVNDWDGGLAEAGMTLDDATARFCDAD